jgi:UDP-N-acetylglucosamine--N-acetylmuramyl-(pentapeptide) pyrophosphoryl-undecaprenol N-acetylglucosamine transferase
MGRFAVIAGGGTAGHVHPGLAVARELVGRGRPAQEILYVGSEHGIEHELVPGAGFDLVSVPGRGIPRSVSIAAVRAGANLSRGVVSAIGLLRHERPRVVLSLGGFAAVPCAVAALLLGIPVVIHEQNAVPGAANRLISRWAKSCAVSFEGTPLPRPVVTGNPVRAEMLAVDRSSGRQAARSLLGVEDHRTLVVVTGGSLGALRLNQAAIEAATVWGDRDDLCLRHVVGERDWELLASERDQIDGRLQYQPVRYESAMPTVFTAADLVVSRAGASTTAELAAVGVASILVPLPGAPGDHQTANAQALVRAGGASLITDEELTGASLALAVDDLLRPGNELASMGAAAATVGRRDAAARVADLLEFHAK